MSEDFERFDNTPEDPFRAEQPSSGSYYSPRSGESGGGSVPPRNPYDPCAEPHKKHSSHTGLKVLGLFAAIAFISYASIQTFQFVSQNDKMRKFFGHDSSISEEEDSGKKSAENKDEESGKNTEQSYSNVEQDWIQLASRDNAMKIPDIVDKVMPANVGVSSTFLAKGQTISFFGFGSEPYEEEMQGSGTGIVMSEDGYIITNAHVIYDSESQYQCGEAQKVEVVLNDDYYKGQTTYEATIQGYDIEEDIAVLKIDADQKLTPAEFGDSDDLRVGELVVAIGNPLGFDYFGSVTTGIVSGLNRDITINDKVMRMIQTDTAINNGNSGGALINSYGQVIGINSAKLSSSYNDEATIEGLCFAIPITHAKSVIDDLISFGYVRKPTLGIMTENVEARDAERYDIPMGVLVREVTPGGAADVAGIKKKDIIIAVNGESVSNFNELNAIKNKYKAGDTITLTVVRSGKDIEIPVTLQEKGQDDQ